jgi:hypothetical protein
VDLAGLGKQVLAKASDTHQLCPLVAFSSHLKPLPCFPNASRARAPASWPSRPPLLGLRYQSTGPRAELTPRLCEVTRLSAETRALAVSVAVSAQLEHPCQPNSSSLRWCLARGQACHTSRSAPQLSHRGSCAPSVSFTKFTCEHRGHLAGGNMYKVLPHLAP